MNPPWAKAATGKSTEVENGKSMKTGLHEQVGKRKTEKLIYGDEYGRTSRRENAEKEPNVASRGPTKLLTGAGPWRKGADECQAKARETTESMVSWSTGQQGAFLDKRKAQGYRPKDYRSRAEDSMRTG